MHLDLLRRLRAGEACSSSDIAKISRCLQQYDFDQHLTREVEELQDEELKTFLEESLGVDRVTFSQKRALPAGTTGRLHAPLPLRKLLISTSTYWQFDADMLDRASQGKSLSTLLPWLFQDADLYDQLDISQTAVKSFATTIESKYFGNPYHNNVHVTSVLQMLHMILTTGGIVETLFSQDDEGSKAAVVMAAAYVAAAGHDAGHRGLTNECLTVFEDSVAETYNDLSSNENYHCRTTLRAIKESGMFENVSSQTQRFIKKAVTEMIVKTDMKYHATVCRDFNLTDSHESHDNDYVLGVLQMCLKCADLGHVTLSWSQHSRWVERLEEEMFRQGDQERARGLPVSPLMDRSKQGISKAQVYFLSTVARPMYESLSTKFPKCGVLLQGLEDNLAKWRKVEM